MRGICKHGNPLSNSCSFCKVEGRKADPPDSGKPIPRANSRRTTAEAAMP